jgi:L,D-transpeptidase ErfK/SrfK
LNIHTNYVKTTALVVLVYLVSACSALNGFMAPFSKSDAPAVELPPPEARARLTPINRNYFVLESPDQTVIGEPQIVFTKEENTFSDLAREYGLGYDELVEANPDVDPWLPGDGTRVILPTQYVLPDVPREGVVLNLASKRLFYFPPAHEGQPQIVMTYPIGIGRVGWQTPLGSSAVVYKAQDPHWYVPTSVRKERRELGDPLPAVVPPGPDNPLGRHVLKLDIPGYLIHGTNQPYGVGMRVSYGCIRLYPEDIELLYDLIGVGASVTIINEPYLAGWKDGQIYFEGHAPLEDDEVSVEQRLVNVSKKIEMLASEKETDIDLKQMHSAANAMLGIPVILDGDAPDALLARARVIENTVEQDPDLLAMAEVSGLFDASLKEKEEDDKEAAADGSATNE